MAIRYDANTSAVRERLWPLVEEAMSKPNTVKRYKNLLNDFISHRSDKLYDNIPCDRIMCSENEMDKLFDILDIKKSVVKDIIEDTYYGKVANFNPVAAKHEFTVTMICLIRYLLLQQNHQIDIELSI